METKAISFGRSLAVPFVQELAKKGLTSVPPRYVHHDQDPPIISLDFCSPQVPVIDMQRLLSEDFTDSELQKLDQACREWGFFQLINHEMSSRLVEKLKLETEEFFKLPMEEKSKYGQQEGDVEGYGNVFVVSEDQKLHWGDKLFFTTSPPHLRKPHLFPNLPPSFRDTLEAYSTGLINVAARILGLIGKNLRIDNNEMALLSEGRQSVSFNYYPPCPQPEQVIGIAPHSDSSGITILLEVNDVQGLQIKKDGMWIPVKPLPNAFIINIGDILEILSNGTYRSIEHRATVNSLKERISVATFCNPKMDGEIGPAPSLVTPETPAMFRRISTIDYIKGLFSRKIDGKSYLDAMRIQKEQGKSN
ncbi:hypothetical protein LWI29_032712 [Acer saccharum]|uniref:Fe2OG dioxygenase domain-containing protein n=1 Tax=Acer saccharum TaxID=4024 RepID=A0AA39RTM8_ACESA|nr:hypothetical protein LWI29_032712 [Acer saccharum]KAK1557665.1 hypothetical protein Q3G72_029187 [Acer saccharum]